MLGRKASGKRPDLSLILNDYNRSYILWKAVPKSGSINNKPFTIMSLRLMNQGPDSLKVSSLKSEILVSNLRFFLDFSQI